MTKALGVVDFQGYTARNLKTGKFVTTKQAGKLVKDKIVEIFKKKPKISSETIDAGLGIGRASKSAEESAKVFMENGFKEVSKKPSMWKKALKWGAIGLAIAGLVGLGTYIYTQVKNSRKTSDTPVKPTPVKPTPAKPAPTKPTPVKPTPVKPEPSKSHTVKEGDNLWNIAKQYLINQHKKDPNYKPTNKEILEKTEELMKLNNKKYEQPLPKDSKKRNVLIVPGEKIKLSA